MSAAYGLVRWYQILRPPIVGVWKSTSFWIDIRPGGDAIISRPPESYGSDPGLRHFLFDDDNARSVQMKWRTRSTLLFLINPGIGKETEPIRYSISDDNLTMTLYIGRIPIDFYRAD